MPTVRYPTGLAGDDGIRAQPQLRAAVLPFSSDRRGVFVDIPQQHINDLLRQNSNLGELGEVLKLLEGRTHILHWRTRIHDRLVRF